MRSGAQTAESFNDILERLRSLWVDHGNVGALRDAWSLCTTSEPPQALPAWLATAAESFLFSTGCGRLWSQYERDMVDLHRFHLFGLARAHGLSREEAAAFVTDAEWAAKRGTSASVILKIQRDVPRRAKVNPGKYYIAGSVAWPDLGYRDWDEAIAKAQKHVTRRRGRPGFKPYFLRGPRVSRESKG